MRNTSGFTLIEMVIALAVAAFLLTVAVPSFMNMLHSNRMVANANEMVAAFNYARSLAVTRGVQVRIQATDDAWHNGWTITELGDNTLMRQHAALKSMNVTGAITSITYEPAGFIPTDQVGGASASLVICPASDGEGKPGREFLVRASGQVLVEKHDSCSSD